jgi:hypothetical protein
MLKEAKREKRFESVIRGVQFGAGVECKGGKNCMHKDCDKAKFVNIKAMMFSLLSDDMKRQDGIELLEETVYLEELPSILYGFDSKGRMLIESKEDYKKRTGRGSPDTADSLALANYGHYEEMNTGKITKSLTEFSPPFAASLGASKQW